MRFWSSSLLAASLMLASPALAQEGTPPTPPPPAPGGEQQPGEGQREGRRERSGHGGRGNFMRDGLPLDQMKEQLGLTPEQVTQLEALNAELKTKGTEMREAMRNGDMSGMQNMRAYFEELRTKVEGMLTPEQRTKMQEMGGAFGGGRGGFGGPGGPGGGRGGPERNRARLKEQALEALALKEDEAAVVVPLLDTVLETRETLMREGDERRQQFLQKARETTDQAALTKLLEEFRTAREADRAQGKAAMDQLREVLTVEQEAKLVGLNVLD